MSLNYNQIKIGTNQVVSFYCAKEREVYSIKSVISGEYNKKEVKKMEENMIVTIEKYLDELQEKTVRVRQRGFIKNQFTIESMMYKIQSDILNLIDKTKEVYLSLNLNQVYQVEIGKCSIVLFLDNDTEIQISL